MSDYEIGYEESGSKGAWFVEVDGERLADMTFSRVGPSKVIIDHTGVDASLKGKGVGKALVFAAVEWARETSTTILPLCPFAKAMIDRHPEWQDVLE